MSQGWSYYACNDQKRLVFPIRNLGFERFVKDYLGRTIWEL